MKTLEERVQALEDIRECEQLQYKYETYLDTGYIGEKIASLFVPDGLWEIKGYGGRAKGHDAIIAHAKNLGKAIVWGQHHMMAPMITLGEDGKTATGTFRLFCVLTLEENGKREAHVLVGNYSNQYVKVDGKWYFKELTGVIEQAAPWDKGWVACPITKENW